MVLVIRFLGGAVPDVVESSVWLTKPQRAAKGRGARRDCFEELRRLVGPHTDKLYERKVLDHGKCSISASREVELIISRVCSIGEANGPEQWAVGLQRRERTLRRVPCLVNGPVV